MNLNDSVDINTAFENMKTKTDKPETNSNIKNIRDVGPEIYSRATGAQAKRL
jgi:hypothetical protein